MKNEVIDLLINRRSIRKYETGQISDEELNLIIEAGRHAPSGGNNQSSHFIVIQNKEILDQLKTLVENQFANMEVSEEDYINLKFSITQSKKGEYDFTYGAPTLVIAANDRTYGNAMADCAVALENMMIAAFSLGVGSCWVNQLRWLSGNKTVVGFLKNLGLKDEEIICGALVLGYPVEKNLPPRVRKGNDVTYIK